MKERKRYAAASWPAEDTADGFFHLDNSRMYGRDSMIGLDMHPMESGKSLDDWCFALA